jgi:uncharacterized protein
MLRKNSLKYVGIALLGFSLLEVTAASELEASQKTDSSDPKTLLTKKPASVFKTLEWDDLMPADDLDALQNPPNYLYDFEDDSDEDQINSQLANAVTNAVNDRYQQALVSTSIISEMDGRNVRVPGFVVPLEFDDEQTITEFFLVPYFGACIHSPPPPPNQIIYVRAPKGIQLETLYDPFWISGKLSTKLVENYMATAAYSMEMESYEDYKE